MIKKLLLVYRGLYLDDKELSLYRKLWGLYIGFMGLNNISKGYVPFGVITCLAGILFLWADYKGRPLKTHVFIPELMFLLGVASFRTTEINNLYALGEVITVIPFITASFVIRYYRVAVMLRNYVKEEGAKWLRENIKQ